MPTEGAGEYKNGQFFRGRNRFLCGQMHLFLIFHGNLFLRFVLKLQTVVNCALLMGIFSFSFMWQLIKLKYNSSLKQYNCSLR